MGKIWAIKTEFQVRRGPEGVFILMFDDPEEKERIYEGGPWLIDNNLMVLKKWPPDKSITAIDFSTNAFWIQILGLPPINWNEENNVMPARKWKRMARDGSSGSQDREGILLGVGLRGGVVFDSDKESQKNDVFSEALVAGLKPPVKP
ncbi:hypothetical protein GH714_015142 [Hevea brasiliensis]|uniref:DUF4283 domain-containing protein n=1 Tax=Hevea brasiliensis TaxID=3981 RepID=A0A6A6NHB8_HEVBR|nr:hypothetical protein GH714_015142 [Hevea brasiliensis]